MDPIKAKIIELIPEIDKTPEVQIGDRAVLSQFAIENGVPPKKKYCIIVGSSSDGRYWRVLWDGLRNPQTYAKEYIELSVATQRDITLADVLRAMDMTRSRQFMWMVGTHGMFVSYERDREQQTLPSNITWNLTTDYDNQTQEVKAFIGKIIGVTETL